jgi:hypothetical protein
MDGFLTKKQWRKRIGRRVKVKVQEATEKEIEEGGGNEGESKREYEEELNDDKKEQKLKWQKEW